MGKKRCATTAVDLEPVAAPDTSAFPQEYRRVLKVARAAAVPDSVAGGVRERSEGLHG